MIKVNYDIETALVKGYYPDSISYASIPEPFIEIENDAQVLDKQMCVIDGVYQEYVKPADVALEEAKKQKIQETKQKRDVFLNSNITVSTGEYKATQTAKNLFFNAVNGKTWNASATLPWRLADDITWVNLTKTDAFELYDAFEAQETSGYQQESGFIRSINSAQTVEDVNSIVIEFK